MKSILSALATLTIAMLVLLTPSLAQALTLDSIGASQTTGGTPGSQWWYTSNNPTLSGTAAANSTVYITIDGQTSSVTASSEGTWTYAPTTLTIGSHSISVVGDGQTISFTLTIGQSATTTTATASATTLPASGTFELTVMIMAAGSLLLLGGWKLSQKVE